MLEKRDAILKCDIIQGTTYTPLAFLQFPNIVVSHFGSTTSGFLKSVPHTRRLKQSASKILYQLKKDDVLEETSLKTRRPLQDIAAIENYSAEKVNYIIATSQIVKENLIEQGIDERKIKIIYNAIEDYWFQESNYDTSLQDPALIHIGRIAKDPFTLKLKGIDRLIHLYQRFPHLQKVSFVSGGDKKLTSWLEHNIEYHVVYKNMKKEHIPRVLQNYEGSIFLLTSRYEGFSLSLIEGMSQGLVPVSYPVGIAPEIIQNGMNGYIVKNCEEAEEAINILLEKPGLRKEMAYNAKITAQKFKAQHMLQEMMSFYEDICHPTCKVETKSLIKERRLNTQSLVRT